MKTVILAIKVPSGSHCDDFLSGEKCPHLYLSEGAPTCALGFFTRYFYICDEYGLLKPEACGKLKEKKKGVS